MKQVSGAELPRDQQEEAKRAYVHRFTKDHTPAWARKPMPNGSAYPVQFASDADWLAHTLFHVTNAGTLASSDCESSPTWPDNPELRRGGHAQ